MGKGRVVVRGGIVCQEVEMTTKPATKPGHSVRVASWPDYARDPQDYVAKFTTFSILGALDNALHVNDHGIKADWWLVEWWLEVAGYAGRLR